MLLNGQSLRKNARNPSALARSLGKSFLFEAEYAAKSWTVLKRLSKWSCNKSKMFTWIVCSKFTALVIEGWASTPNLFNQVFNCSRLLNALFAVETMLFNCKLRLWRFPAKCLWKSFWLLNREMSHSEQPSFQDLFRSVGNDEAGGWYSPVLLALRRRACHLPAKWLFWSILLPNLAMLQRSQPARCFSAKDAELGWGGPQFNGSAGWLMQVGGWRWMCRSCGEAGFGFLCCELWGHVHNCAPNCRNLQNQCGCWIARAGSQ